MYSINKGTEIRDLPTIAIPLNEEQLSPNILEFIANNFNSNEKIYYIELKRTTILFIQFTYEQGKFYSVISLPHGSN